ncbi:unnamed protein product [Lymnaea stagnalis]|uniref:Secreted protein n=1 Tax=Lymnaea stagnalis TaxID=6523 RepID=A0AAV2HLZ5_LYMST
MNALVVWLGLCAVMIVHVHKAHSQMFSLDEYCSYELPKMKRGDPGYLSVLKLIKLCSDIETYTSCLKRTRGKTVVNNIYKLHDFEKHFPSDDDMERAGYLFCIVSLISDPYMYNVSPGKVTACHSKVNEVKCEVANEPLSGMLTAAVANNSTDTIASLGCTMYTSYWTCMRDEYAACNPDMKPMFDYYLARAGASCLKTKKLFNPVIFGLTCNGVLITQTPGTLQPTPKPPGPQQPNTNTAFTSTSTMETTTQPRRDGGDSTYGSGCQSSLLVLGMTCVALAMMTHRGPYDSPLEN